MPEGWNGGILKHGTVVKILTIGTHGFFPHKCSGQKRKWRSELYVPQSFSVPRCFRSEDFGKVVKKELHHFSDANTNGYGQCSYFIVVKKVAVIHLGEVQ